MDRPRTLLAVARRGLQDEPALDAHGAPEGEMAPLSRDALVQKIENVDENHQDAHRRLRNDLDSLKLEMNNAFRALREDISANKSSIELVKQTPLDATKLVLSSRVVVALVAIALGIAAAVWSIRSGMEQISDKMEATAKLQDVQTSALKSSVDDMKRRQELQQYEIQGLKEAILVGNKANGRK